jgi:uncharacterized protein (TIGR02118 family)
LPHRRRNDFAARNTCRSTSMSATLLALYKKPADTAAFDAYYKNHHAPIAKTLPGLVSFTLGRGTDKDPYYLVAILTFASIDALNAALGSSAGAATVADLGNFAQAGVDVLTFADEPA